ncbi:hypothetical protein BsWGS_23441 [Bradybaena similaris]
MESRPDRTSRHDNRTSLFSSHLRLQESDITEMEADLTQLLIHFQKTTRSRSEQKNVLAMFLKLASGEVNEGAVSDGEIEQNNDKLALGNVVIVPCLGSGDQGLGEAKSLNPQRDSRSLINNCSGEFQSGDEKDAFRDNAFMDMQMLIADEQIEKDSRRDECNNKVLEEVCGTEADQHSASIQSTQEVVVDNVKPSMERSDDCIEKIMTGREPMEKTNTTSSDRSADSHDNPEMDFCSLDVDKHEASVSQFGGNTCTHNIKEYVNDDNKLAEPLSSMHIMNEPMTTEVADLECKHPQAEDVEGLQNAIHNFSASSSLAHNRNEPSALSSESLRHIGFTQDEELGSGMKLNEDAKQADENVVQDTDSAVTRGLSMQGTDSAVTRGLSMQEGATMAQRTSRGTTTIESGGTVDSVRMTARFVMKMQQRLIRGIGFPPAKIHHLITMFLSRLWQTGPGETAHSFGAWLYNPDVARTVQSLIYSVKTVRLPQELVNILTNVIVTAVLHNLVDYKGCLPDGVIKTVELFLVEILSIAEKLLSEGRVTSKDFVTNILDSPHHSRHTQVTLIYSPWKSMLHQAKVAMQLSVVSSEERAKLEKLVLDCGEKLTDTAFDSVTHCLEQLHSRMEDEAFKLKSVLVLSGSVVATIHPTVEAKQITGLTLLPGSLTSRSGLAPGRLGQDSIGEAVVLLTLDSLARDMGEDTLDRLCLGHIAASLADLLTRGYGYQHEALEGEGLAGGLDCMTSRFRCKSLEFADSCKILSAILRPYLGYLLMEDRNPCFKVDLGDPASVDEDLLSSLFDFITEVFVAFVRGMIARMRHRWVGNELHDDLLVLYVWRTMAGLAKEANKLLCHKNDTDKRQKKSFKCAGWNLGALLGLVDTFRRDNREDSSLRGNSEGDSAARTPGENCAKDSAKMADVFMACLSRRLPEPGYVPVPDLNMPNQAMRNDSVTATISRAIKVETIPANVEEAARREIISACRPMFEFLVAAESLQKMRGSMANHVACAVFMMGRFTTMLSEKLWAVKEGMSNNSLTVHDVIPFLVNSRSQMPLQVVVSNDTAFKILIMAILELEEIQKSVSVLCRLVEHLTRIDQQPSGVRGHASSVLSAVSPTDLTQFIRAFITFALRMVAWLLDRMCHEHASSRMEAPLRQYASDVTKLTIDVVCDVVKSLKQLAGRESKLESGCTTRNVVCPAQDLLLQTPTEVSDNVLGCIIDIIESMGSAEVDTENDTPTPSDMIACLISQLLTSMNAFVDTGNFYFMRVNDLLRTEKPSKTDRLRETTDAVGNNGSTRQRSETKDLLTSLQQRDTEYLLKHLVQIITSIGGVLKQEINAAVLVNKSCDSLLHAAAFMNVKLGKVQRDLAKKCITLSNLQSGLTCACDEKKPFGVKSGAGDGESNMNALPFETRKADDGKMPMSRYIENLLRNLTDVKPANKGLNRHPARVIKVILKACYTVDVSYLVPESIATNSNEVNVQSVLLMEIMINELYNRLAEVEKTRAKEIDKETNYPYLFSRVYTTPDPWGPYYSDVAVRARQLTDTVRVGSATRYHLQRLSAVSSLMSSQDESVICESSQAEEDVASGVCDGGTTVSDSLNAPRRSSDRKGQTRVATWRRKVQDCSSVHNTDNSLNLWVRNEAKMLHKRDEFQRISKKTDTAQEVETAALTNVDNTGTLEKVDPEEVQTSSVQQKVQKKSTSALKVGQKCDKPSKPAVKSIHKNVIAGKFYDTSKQQKKRTLEKNKDNMKETKLGSSKTCGEMRVAATQKHISRMTRRKTSNKRGPTSAEAECRDVWPRTVHIIHHAYADSTSALQPPSHGENNADFTGVDESLNKIVEDQPKESHPHVKSPGLPELPKEQSCDHQLSASKRVLISFLAKELPQQTMAACRCLGTEVLEALEAVDLANVLSVVDLTLAGLEQGDEARAMHVLEDGSRQGEVSQRTAAAITNLLQSVANNAISDEEIQAKLADVQTDTCENVDVHTFRQQLITCLSVMAEKVEEGSKLPEVFTGRQAQVLTALRYAREMSETTKGEGQQQASEGNNEESEGGSSAAEHHLTDSKTNTNCLTPSCNTALTSVGVSVSDDDSNDDKCIISSSWTILSSCPSLSSSRSSNIVHAGHDGSAAESTQGQRHKTSESPKADDFSEDSKVGEFSGRIARAGTAGDAKDGSEVSGRDSRGHSDSRLSSRKDVESNNSENGLFSGRSSRADVSEIYEKQQSGRTSKGEAGGDEYDDWPVSGQSSKTDIGDNCISDGHEVDNRPEAGRPYSQQENGQASVHSSWSSSLKSTRCSSTRSSIIHHRSPIIDEINSTREHSRESAATAGTPSGERRDTPASGRSSRSEASCGRDDATLSVSMTDRPGRSSGAQSSSNSTEPIAGDPEGSHRLSKEHRQADEVSEGTAAEDEPDSDRYSTDGGSCGSGEEDGCEPGRQLETDGAVDVRAGGNNGSEDVGDSGGDSEM